MKKSLEEKLRYVIENDKLNFEKFLGNGCKWYDHHLIVNELVWARNFRDGYELLIYSDEYKNEHIATFIIDYVVEYNHGYHFVPRLQTDYIREDYAA